MAATTSENTPKPIRVRFDVDDSEMTIDLSDLNRFTTIKNMLGDCDVPEGEALPIPNVSRISMEHILRTVKFEEAEKDKIFEYFKSFPLEELSAALLAANYLDAQLVLDQTCRVVAQVHIKGKTPEEIRKMFNIKNDFTPEEEEQIRKENAWCEE